MSDCIPAEWCYPRLCGCVLVSLVLSGSGYKRPCFSFPVDGGHTHTHPTTGIKLQNIPSRCWFFFHMITFVASILVTRRHGRLFFWRSAESRFDCGLLIVDACSFNDQMICRALTLQSVILLMEIIWNSATHEWSTLTWSFLEALNNWCRSRVSQPEFWFLFFLC